MSEPKQNVLRIHLLVPDEVGPIQSAPGGTTFKIGTRRKFRVACDSTIELGTWNRGTTEPWGVRCQACRETADFRLVDRPKPGVESEEVPDATE